MILSKGTLEAGENGFIWRDQTILEKIAESGALQKESRKQRLFAYALLLVGMTAMVITTKSLLVASVIIAATVFFKVFPLDRGTRIGGITFTLAPLVMAVITYGLGPYLIWVACAMLLLTLFIRHEETRAYALFLVSGTPLLPSPYYGIILPVLTTGLLVFSWARNASVLRRYHKRSKGKADMPLVPIGYYKASKQVLGKALRINNDSVSSKHRGSLAERVTAIKLKKTLPKGSVLYNDLPFPGADVANIDHLVISPHGMFIIDSKLFAGRIVLNEDGSVSKETDKSESLAPVTKQMRWALQAFKPYSPDKNAVKVIVAVQEAAMEGMVVDKSEKGAPIAYIPLNSCAATIERFPVVFSAKDIEDIQARLDAIVEDRTPVYPKNTLKRVLRLKNMRFVPRKD